MKKPKPKVFVVDDEQDVCEVMEGMLRMNQFDVRTFTSGADLVNALKAEIPEAILLDILMPGMDGHELCRLIKGNPKLAGIKVCFLSALETAEEVQKGVESGGDDYIKKSMQHRFIIERIKKLLQGGRTADA